MHDPCTWGVNFSRRVRAIETATKAYLVQLRLNAARRRLAMGVQAADVAAECGFYAKEMNRDHFCQPAEADRDPRRFE